jgi:hypothetical protein
MHCYLCPPKVDLRAFLVTQGVIPLQKQYNGSYWKRCVGTVGAAETVQTGGIQMGIVTESQPPTAGRASDAYASAVQSCSH